MSNDDGFEPKALKITPRLVLKWAMARGYPNHMDASHHAYCLW